jgi:uncharacterized protein YdeI (BOF family)
MNKFVRTVVTASVLVSGPAFAQDQAKHATDKRPLRDSQQPRGPTTRSRLATHTTQM